MVNRHRQRSGAWGVLLAGGDGTRLQSLTTRIEGDSRPKQFCRILGGESLLGQTRRRICPLFHGDRTLAVVTRKHESFYARELGDLRETAIVAQPENLGTGIAIAAMILTVLERDADAIVAFFPCDHHYTDESAFLNVVEAGIVAARNNPETIVLLGAEPTSPETEYGWIEPVRAPTGGACLAPARVHQFWEKPTLATAQRLMRRGCLWNTFVTIARAGAFVDMFHTSAPNVMLTLSTGIKARDLDLSYRTLPRVDFSRDVLASQPKRLLVIRDAISGWTDLGTPSRVFDTLSRQGTAPNWLESIHSTGILAAG
jgi:mannose-1-phosphate guanylyltransferase